MKICTLRNGNLYLAKWKSVLCEMEICTLRNGNLYIAKWNSVHCERKLLLSNFMKNFCKEASANLVFTYNHDRDTRFSFMSPHRTASSWCLENLGPQAKTKPFCAACLPRIASAKLAALCFLHHSFRLLVDRLCFALLRDDYINLISPCHQHDSNNSEGCTRSFCWVNIAWRKCTMKERVNYSNAFLTLFGIFHIKLQKYQTSGEEF